MPLFDWHKRHEPPTRPRPDLAALNRIIAPLGTTAFFVFNEALSRYEVWDEVLGGGAEMVLELEEQGQPLPWEACRYVALARLSQMRQGPEAVLRAVEEHNEALKRQQEERARAEILAVTEYVAPALQAELDGTLRHGAEDVFLGVRAAFGDKILTPAGAEIQEAG